ncbi:MAG: putative copper-binding protein [Verrucomicrobiales bacterium]|nr:putative copper-binding protein [Verrucomicrobiales bacterium]
MKYRALIFAVILTGIMVISAPAATNLVRILHDSSSGTTKYLFIPSNIVIRTSDTIRWTNTTTTAHDSTHSPASGSPLWASGPFAPPTTFSFTFPNVGYFPYHCLTHLSHPEQNGLISVVSVNVTNPPSNGGVAADAPFTISAPASTNVASIQFFTNGISAGTDNSSPFSLSLGGLPIGSYTLSTKVTDTRGNTNTFAGPTFMVENITISELVSTKSSVSFNVHGAAAGQRCIIYASSDISNPLGWAPVSTNTFPPTDCVTCPFVTFQDTNVTGNIRRFFKAQVVP